MNTRLEVDLDFENKSIKGKVSHTIEPVGSPLDSIELDAVGMSFSSVKVNGAPSDFDAMEDKIRVKLASKLMLGSKAEVSIDYSTSPTRGLYFRGPTKDFPNRPYHAFTQGQSEDTHYWFPCYDYPNMRTKTETVIRAPARMTVISNGKLVSVDDQGENRSWHFVQDIPYSSYLVSLVAGEYEKIAEMHDGVQLEYYVPSNRKEDAARSFEKTKKMLDVFKKITGQKYPYAKYSQTVVYDFMFGGMENISATTLTERTLHDERAHLDFTSDNLVSHELAHQWFGDYLTCKDWSNAWLNEGFATYFNALFREQDEGWDDFQYHMQSDMDTLLDEIDERYQRPVVTKRYWDADELFDSHTYEKGAWALNTLRGFLGDETFFRGIRNYVAKFGNSIVETPDFRKAMEEASGLDLESFFDQWLYSAGIPDYKATFNWHEDTRISEVDLEQANSGIDGVPLFSTPIEIRFTFAAGKKVSKRVKMTASKSSFHFYFEEKPLNVNIDPSNWILKKLKFQKPKEMHLYQLANDENSMERIRAAQELQEFKTDDVIEALSSTIENDKFWGVRFEAAKAIGKVGTAKSFEVLVSKKGHKDHKVRRGVAFAMREFATSGEFGERAIGILEEFLNNDQSYYVRANAAWSLGFFKSVRAFDALKSGVSQKSVNDEVRYRTFMGFAERKDPGAIPIAVDYLRNGRDYRGRAAAAYALGKIGKNSNDAMVALLDVRHDPDVRVRSQAPASIGYLGDASVVSELEEWLANETEGRVRRKLRETIHHLKEGLVQSDQVSRLNQEVEKLAQENKSLSGRIAILESKKGS